MKRDMDLIRYIMISLEEEMNAGKLYPSQNINFKQFSNEVDEAILNEHLMLLFDNEYIDAVFSGTKTTPTSFMIKRITNDGYDFLDALRDDNIWTQVKNKTTEIGGFTLSLLIELGKDYLKQKISNTI